MPWNGRAPEDRATAQILIVFGAMVLALGIGAFWVAAANGNLDGTTRRGFPIALIAPVVAAFGGWLVWRGIAMYRADKSPRR